MRMDYSKALCVACEEGNLEDVQSYIRKVASVNIVASDGWTPLNTASYNGCTAVAKLLIESGANVNQAGRHGWTPLYLAAYKGCSEVAKLLIASDANIHLKTCERKTALDIATQMGHEGVVELLKQASKDEIRFSDWIETCPEACRELVDHFGK